MRRTTCGCTGANRRSFWRGSFWITSRAFITRKSRCKQEQAATRRFGYTTRSNKARITIRKARSFAAGCPNWPQCYKNGRLVAESDTHAWIEFSNRLFSGLVAFLSVAAGVLAWFRRPYRRDLMWLGAMLA